MIISIIGPNGSGKSTVRKGQTRLLGYKSGAVYIDDRHLKNFSTKELARNIGVVMVLHDFSHAMEVSDWIVVVKDGKNTARASQRISSPRR